MAGVGFCGVTGGEGGGTWWVGRKLFHRRIGVRPMATRASWLAAKTSSQYIAPDMKPYECRPTPRRFVPNHDHAVTTLPMIASRATPRCLTRPPQRACRIRAFQMTTSRAPFSFGSQPQKRPQDWSAQMPPNTVPVKLNRVAKQTIP